MNDQEFQELRIGDRVVLWMAQIFGDVTVANKEGVEVHWDDGIISWYTVLDCQLISVVPKRSRL